MAPTTDDLRAVLRTAADEHPAPAPRDLLTALRTARGDRRRRTVLTSGLVAASVAALGVVGWQAADRSGLLGDRDTVQPAGEPGSAVARGWVLADGQPPQQADGLARVGTAQVPYAGPSSVTLPTADRTRFAVLWCDAGPDDPAITQPSLAARVGERQVSLPCVPRDREPSTVTPVALPDGQDLTDLRWSGDVPGGGAAVLGVYREATWSEYHFTGWPDPPLAAPAEPTDGTAVSIGPSVAASDAVPADWPGSNRTAPVRTVTVVVAEDAQLELWAGAPAQLTVVADGRVVTADPAGTDDPELRDGRWAAFTAGQTRVLDLPHDDIRVTLQVQGPVDGAPWRVTVRGTVPSTPVPFEDRAASSGSGFPEWYGGMRLLGSWSVPAGDEVVDLQVPPALQGAGGWAAGCRGAVTDLRNGSVGITRVVFGDGALTDQVGCTGPDGLGGRQLPFADRPAITDQVPLHAQVVRPEGSYPTGVRVGAYLPVSYKSYDHHAGHPLPPLGYAEEETRTVASADAGDLDAQGRVTLRLTQDVDALELSSTGVGRVRLLVDGRPTDRGPVDGWWTAWTDEPYTSLVGADPAGMALARAGQTITLEPEGYQGGSWSARLIQMVHP